MRGVLGAVPVDQRGQGAPLPLGAGLGTVQALGDHRQVALRFGRLDADGVQALASDGQQRGEQFGYRALAAAALARVGPHQPGLQAVLGAAVEVVLGQGEGQGRQQAVDVRAQALGQTDVEGGVGDHVDRGRSGGQGAQFDAQVAAVGRIVHRPVPQPDRALVQTQLFEGRNLAAGHRHQRVFLAAQGEEGRIEQHRLGEQLMGPLAHPAGAEAHPRALVPVIAILDAGVDALLEQRDAGLAPQVMAEQAG